MTDTSVTISDLGTVIATSGTLVSVTLAEPPTEPPTLSDWFTLSDTNADGIETTVFNVQTASTPVPVGTSFPLYNHPINKLVLKSISAGAKWVVTTNPASARKSSQSHTTHREPSLRGDRPSLGNRPARGASHVHR
jgi:hypothetical protein